MNDLDGQAKQTDLATALGGPCVTASRRSFFAQSSAVVGLAAFCGCSRPSPSAPVVAAPPPQEPEVAALTEETRANLTPEQIIERAKDGNQRYLSGTLRRRDFLAEQRNTAAGQYPAAVVLGCIDSRGPAEIIFNLGIGDVFNCRVAGNVASPEIPGSMEFATQLSGAKLLVVLGHSACGAIKGAISGATLGNLTQLLARIRPAIEATDYAGDRSVKNAEFVDAVARRNVEQVIAAIRRDSEVIARLEASGALKIVGAFHDIATGSVEFMS